MISMAFQDRKQLLERSWTEVAALYENTFVPRFMPWTLETIREFLAAGIPDGDVLVPCCGPGERLWGGCCQDKRFIATCLAWALKRLTHARRQQGTACPATPPAARPAAICWPHCLHPRQGRSWSCWRRSCLHPDALSAWT